MPMYEFECEKCKKVKDAIVKFSEADDPIACDCEEDAKMIRVDKLYRTGHKYRGIWYKTTGQY